WLAAALPFTLSVATAADWGQPLLVLALFLALELAVANFVEPLLFGHGTGLTPVALLLAAVFWAWLWGPIGLLLSAPLTVCLVVLGKHVSGLKFLDVLLGDEPPLGPAVRFYQRLLAGDEAGGGGVPPPPPAGGGLRRHPVAGAGPGPRRPPGRRADPRGGGVHHPGHGGADQRAAGPRRAGQPGGGRRGAGERQRPHR